MTHPPHEAGKLCVLAITLVHDLFVAAILLESSLRSATLMSSIPERDQYAPGAMHLNGFRSHPLLFVCLARICLNIAVWGHDPDVCVRTH